jgi:hypothetical protein
MRKKLFVSQFDDPAIQQNFKTIGEIFNAIPFLKGQWRFIEFNVAATGTVTVAHNLTYTPKDAILLSVVNGTIVFNNGSFDDKFISVTATVTTTPMTVRAFIGRYTEDSVNV